MPLSARSSLRSPNQNVEQLLASLDTLPGSLSVLEELHGQWYATSLAVGQSAIPLGLRTLVLSGTPATQHFVLNGSAPVGGGAARSRGRLCLLRGLFPG